MVVVALASCALAMSTETDAEETVVADPSGWEYIITGDTARIAGYNGILSGSLTIPDTISDYKVTSIGTNAFSNTSLTSIEIPSSVTSIGLDAFYNCTNLETVTFSDPVEGGVPSLEEIGNRAFWGCTALTSIEIPSSVTSIGTNAFYNCTNLETVTFSDDGGDPSLEKIGTSAFCKCISLTSIDIPSSVTSIKTSAFDGCTDITVSYGG